MSTSTKTTKKKKGRSYRSPLSLVRRSAKSDRKIGVKPNESSILQQASRMADPAIRAFGRRLKELREAKKMSPAEFEAASGVNRSYLYSLEIAAKQPGLTTILNLARGLGVSPAAFFE